MKSLIGKYCQSSPIELLVKKVKAQVIRRKECTIGEKYEELIAHLAKRNVIITAPNAIVSLMEDSSRDVAQVLTEWKRNKGRVFITDILPAANDSSSISDEESWLVKTKASV
jgi:hypothetical protein